MKELKEIRINDSNLILNGNIVKGGILPVKIAELSRSVDIQADTVVDGPIYASKITIDGGDSEVTGAVFAQHEIYVNSSAAGKIVFRKAVASASAVTARAAKAEVSFCSDVNAKEVSLTNAFVAGSIFADSITLENCVVIGGVFATAELTIKDSIVGTFNSPCVTCDGKIELLLPTAFSQEKMSATVNTQLSNLSLADLGGLFKGNKQSEGSGRIMMKIESDDIKTVLTDDETRKAFHTYTVVGKVLAADLTDSDKFQNHFLLSAAALGPQLLRSYNLGAGEDGKVRELSTENIREFFFKVLHGQIEIQPLEGSFRLSDIAR